MPARTSARPLILVPSSINIDETFSVPHIVRPGETISSSEMSARPGGKGANVAAALGLAGGGEPSGETSQPQMATGEGEDAAYDVYFAGNVGKDAPWPLQELRSRGVRTDLAGELEGVPTGRALIQIAQGDGENSIVLLKGANFPPTPPSPSHTFSLLPRAPTHLVLQNEIPLGTTASFQSAGYAAGALVAWNPSPLPSAAQLRGWNWREVGVLVVNEGEGRELLQALDEAEQSNTNTITDTDADADPEETLARLAALPALRHTLTWLVMTRGAHGVLASVLLEGRDDERAVFSLPASRPEQVRDTTGAGDTFAGYLVSSLAKSWGEARAQVQDQGSSSAPASPQARPRSAEEVTRCLARAKTAAVMAVEVRGAMESIPRGADVDVRLSAEGGQ